jgi:hypothetical protein
MGMMTYDYPTTERGLFYGIALLVLALPGDLALAAYLLLTNFDLSVSHGDFASGSTIGYENLIRLAVVPAVLWFRLRKVSAPVPEFDKVRRTWFLLAFYAILSIWWSPFPFSGMKVAGYLCIYGFLFMILTRAVRAGWVTFRCLACALWGALAIAVIQTHVLGNLGGTGDELVFSERFTSFASPPSFAAFLLATGVAMFFIRRSGLSLYFSLAGAVVGIVMSGSRGVFAGMLAAILLMAVLLPRKNRKRISLRLAARQLLIGATISVLVITLVVHLAPVSRINELIDTVAYGGGDLSDVGSFAWRVAMYEKALSDISSFSIRNALTGMGSGSGGGVKLAVLHGFDFDTVDGARVFHNEFLHAGYEWGLIGLALVIAIYGQLAVASFHSGVRRGEGPGLAAVSIFPALTFSLLFDNVLADAGGAGGTAFTLVFALAAISALYKRSVAEGD